MDKIFQDEHVNPIPILVNHVKGPSFDAHTTVVIVYASMHCLCKLDA